MKLLEILRSLGDRLGVLEVPATTTSTEPAKIETRTITLRELTISIQTEEVHALSERLAEFSVEFDKIFSAAGVPAPAHGWTIERLGHLLRTDSFKTMTREAAQEAILRILAEEKVPVEDLLKDAIARDQTLDAFETVVRRKLEERKAGRERRIAELESQIRELERKRSQTREEDAADAHHWQGWLEKKRACEKDLAWATGYLVDRPIITTDEEPPAR